MLNVNSEEEDCVAFDKRKMVAYLEDHRLEIAFTGIQILISSPGERHKSRRIVML